MAINHQSVTTAYQETGELEVTLGIVKPHAYANRRQIELMILESGLVIPTKKDPYKISKNLAALQYEEHWGKPFYGELIEMMTSGDSELMIVEGLDAITRLAMLAGATDPAKAEKGTIRERYGLKDGKIMNNAFHRSDSPRSAKREILLYWDYEELPADVGRLLYNNL